MIDSKKIEEVVRDFLIALGDNPDRAGLKETPNRVARMCQEVFEGMQYSNEDIAKMFNKCFEEQVTNDLVIVKDIDCFSYCEHHIALMYDMKVTVAYLPKNKVIGLSKIARIVDMVSKRLQLQERIGKDIADILEMVLETNDVAVLIEGKHSCMTARGIKKQNSNTKTSTLRGQFLDNYKLRNELFTILN